jgi:hypothetical protein
MGDEPEKPEEEKDLSQFSQVNTESMAELGGKKMAKKDIKKSFDNENSRNDFDESIDNEESRDDLEDAD